jgi:hypothetical protein
MDSVFQIKMGKTKEARSFLFPNVVSFVLVLSGFMFIVQSSQPHRNWMTVAKFSSMKKREKIWQVHDP